MDMDNQWPDHEVEEDIIFHNSDKYKHKCGKYNVHGRLPEQP